MKKESLHTSPIQRSADSKPFFQKKESKTMPAADDQEKQAQSKSHKSQKGDPYEREADKVADQVVQKNNESTPSTPLHKQITPLSQRKAQNKDAEEPQLVPEEEYRGAEPEPQKSPEEAMPKEEEPQNKEEEGLHMQEEEGQKKAEDQLQQKENEEPQTKLAPTTRKRRSRSWQGATMHGISRLLQLSKAGGSPLPESIKSKLEGLFGVDFGNVRIHTGVMAQKMSRMLHAQAFALGSDVYFNAGKYDPNTKKGMHLLAHELTHTVQQGAVKPTSSKKMSDEGEIKFENTTNTSSGFHSSTSVLQDGEQATSIIKHKANQTLSPESPQSDHPAGQDQLLSESEKQKEEKLAISPQSPEEDPAHQMIVAQVEKTAEQQKKRKETTKKKREKIIPASVMSSKNEARRSAYGPHLSVMESTTEKSTGTNYTKEDFKQEFKDKVKNLAKSLAENKSQFKSSKKKAEFNQAKGKAKNEFSTQKNNLADPLKKETKKKEPIAVDELKAKDLPIEEKLKTESSGKRPSISNTESAAPKPRQDHEITMEKESKKLDDVMEENQVTEQQLEKSQEPDFIGGLSEKRTAQEEAKKVPARYREQEQGILTEAKSGMQKSVRDSVRKIHHKRRKSFSKVGGTQKDKAGQIKKQKNTILDGFRKIYEGTRDQVGKALEPLNEVEMEFAGHIEEANKLFKKNISGQMEYIYTPGWLDYSDWDEKPEIRREIRKEARKLSQYPKIIRWPMATKKVQDWDAKRYFEYKKGLFIDRVEQGVEEIGTKVAKALNKAKQHITEGLVKAKKFKESFKGPEAKEAKKAYDMIRFQFQSLESTIDERRQDVINSMAEEYKKNLGKLRETFDKIKDEALTSWIVKAYRKLKAIALAIYRLGKLLVKLLSRVASMIGDILQDPIGFFNTLSAGVKRGFAMFKKNMDTYLLASFFDWLKGKIGGTGIRIPKNFGASDLFDLAAQLLSIDYESFKKIARKVYGKKMVAYLEEGAGKAEKGLGFAKQIFNLFAILKKDGLGGLWNHLKEILASRISDIFDKVKEKVLYATIKKALKWIVGLFNPIGGFIKIVMLIYKALSWLAANIGKIEELVDALIDSVSLALNGDVGGVASKVIKGIQIVIVMAIDFLARLLRLGDLAKKVRNMIGRLKKPIINGIEWVLRKMKPTVLKVRRTMDIGMLYGKAIYQKGKEKAKAGAKKLKEKITGKKEKPAEAEEALDPKDHNKIAKEAVMELEKPVSSANDYQTVREAKENQAREISQRYSAVLEEGIGLTVKFKNSKEDVKDDDVDFTVRIAPNDEVVNGSVPFKSKFNKGDFVIEAGNIESPVYRVSDFEITGNTNLIWAVPILRESLEEKRGRPEEGWELTTKGPSRYREFGKLIPAYRGSKKIRPTFYRVSYSAVRTSLLSQHVDPQKPDNFLSQGSYAMELQVGNMNVIKRIDRNGNGKASLPKSVAEADHFRPTVAKHWNKTGRYGTQDMREAYYANPRHLRIISKKLNAEYNRAKSERYKHEIGEKFRGPDE